METDVVHLYLVAEERKGADEVHASPLAHWLLAGAGPAGRGAGGVAPGGSPGKIGWPFPSLACAVMY